VTFTDVQEVLSTEQEEPGHFTLPPHLRCASHTLNLISTVDIEKWLTVTNKTIYRSATAKLFRARVQIPCRVLHSHKTAYKSFGLFTR